MMELLWNLPIFLFNLFLNILFWGTLVGIVYSYWNNIIDFFKDNFSDITLPRKKKNKTVKVKARQIEDDIDWENGV